MRRQSEDVRAYRRCSQWILRSIDVGIIVPDDNLIVQSWNRWSENIWGLRNEEVTGELFLDLDIGLPVRLLRRPLQDILETQMPAEPVEMPEIDALALTGLVAPLLSGEKAEIVFETTIESAVAGRPARSHAACGISARNSRRSWPPILVVLAHDVTERQRIGADDGRAEAMPGGSGQPGPHVQAVHDFPNSHSALTIGATTGTLVGVNSLDVSICVAGNWPLDAP